MIFIESRKKKDKTLKLKYPNAIIVDLTSKSGSEFIAFSPFYPHADIPVPFSKDIFSYSVEGIWQGLKVFENEDIDTSKFFIKNMRGIKRSIRVFGKIRGHRNGVDGMKILDYRTARKEIFIKSYNWILENKLNKQVGILMDISKEKDLVLLDYETNIDLDNLEKPLSHAGLVKLYIEKRNNIYKAPNQTKLNF